jgi:hypothetical protein
MTTQVSGEVVPSDIPGSLAMAHRQPVGVVFGIAAAAPVILGVRVSPCRWLRQYRDPQIFGVCPFAPPHRQTLVEAGLR